MPEAQGPRGEEALLRVYEELLRAIEQGDQDEKDDRRLIAEAEKPLGRLDSSYPYASEKRYLEVRKEAAHWARERFKWGAHHRKERDLRQRLRELLDDLHQSKTLPPSRWADL